MRQRLQTKRLRKQKRPSLREVCMIAFAQSLSAMLRKMYSDSAEVEKSVLSSERDARCHLRSGCRGSKAVFIHFNFCIARAVLAEACHRDSMDA